MTAHPPQQPWIERTWSFAFPVELYPSLLARLRGTPVRLEEELRRFAPDRLTSPKEGAWSPQRHGGHLVDLEALFQGRLEEFMNGTETLRPADMSNAATDAAEHDQVDLETILAEFRRVRGDYVGRLAQLSTEDFARCALHPRLGTPMRLVDMCLFQADHDDHHLASIHMLHSLCWHPV
ncbi:MAG: hypothetical protein ACI8QS_000967 [Planctomycetota bacterium]|jgi:hypothetical protein